MSFDAGSVIAKLELSIAGWQKSVEAVKADQTSLSGLVLRHEQQFKSLGKTLTVVGGAIVASLGAMVKKTADYGDEMDEMSQRTGASVELLTGLDGVLKKNGASAQDLAVGMKFLSGKMLDANSGNKEAIALFEGLGISVTDANGNLRSTTDVLFDVATKFKGMENGAVKTTVAVDLLGRGGMSLIPTLNLGADGLKKEADQAQRLGKVLTAEAAKACSDFNDSLVDLQGGLQGVGIQIGQMLMPVVQNLVKGITDAVIKVVAWTKSHEDLTRVSATTTLAVGGIAMALGPMLYMLPGLVKGWQTLAAVLKLSTAGLAASVIGLTAVVAAAGVAYDIVTRLTNAKNAATDADYAAFESNQALGQKLREVADAAGLTREQFYQLSLKYDENNAAMAMAIKRGTEGKALQEALATVGKKNAAAIEEQKKKMAEMDPVTRALQDAMSKLGKETKSLAEQLGITFRSETEGRIKKLNEALLMYRGKMTEEQVAKIRAEIESLSKSMKTSLIPAADEVERHMDAALISLENMALKAMGEIERVGDFTADDMAANLDKIAAGWSEIPKGAKPAVEETTSYFDGLFNDIATGFGDTIQSWISGATTFKNFLEGLWGNIKDAFFRMIGELAAKWALGFIAQLLISLGILPPLLTSVGASGVVAGAGLTTTAVGAGAAATAAAAAAVSFAALVTTLAFLAAGLLVVAGLFGLLSGDAAALTAALLAEKAAVDALRDSWIALGVSLFDANERIREILARQGQFGGEAPARGGGPGRGRDEDRDRDRNNYASGGVAWTPQFARLAERKPEIIGNLDDYLAGRPLAGIPQPGGGGGASGRVVNHYSISIQAIDGPSVERLFKTRGREIIDDMFRQNKGGLTRNVNRYLESMA